MARPIRRRLWVWGAAACAVAVSAFFLTYEPFVAMRRLGARIAEARGLGLRTELVPPARPAPGAPNAAQEYTEAIGLAAGPLKASVAEVKIGSKIHGTEERESALRERPRLDRLAVLLERGSRKPELRFNRDPAAGQPEPYRNEAVLTQAAGLFVFDAEEALHAGRYEEALDRIAVAARIAKQIGSYLTVQTGMLRASLVNDVVGVVGEAVAHGGKTPGISGLATKALESAGDAPPPGAFLNGELARGLDAARRGDVAAWRQTGGEEAALDEAAAIARVPFLRSALASGVAEFWLRFKRGLPLPTGIGSFYESSQAVQKAVAEFETNRRPSRALARALYSEYPTAVTAIGGVESRRLAWLAALNPGRPLPDDPNGPGKLRRIGNKIVGRGPDGVDDGGDPTKDVVAVAP